MVLAMDSGDNRTPVHHPTQPMASPVSIHLNVPSDLLKLIDEAAHLQHQSRAAFMRGAAREQAEAVLLSQALMTVDAVRFERFLAALDAPPASNPRLQSLMARHPPWA